VGNAGDVRRGLCYAMLVAIRECAPRLGRGGDAEIDVVTLVNLGAWASLQ